MALLLLIFSVFVNFLLLLSLFQKENYV